MSGCTKGGGEASKGKAAKGEATNSSSGATGRGDSSRLSIIGSRLSVQAVNTTGHLFTSLLRPCIPRSRTLERACHLFKIKVTPPRIPTSCQGVQSQLVFPVQSRGKKLITFTTHEQASNRRKTGCIGSPTDPICDGDQILCTLSQTKRTVQREQFIFIARNCGSTLTVRTTKFAGAITLYKITFATKRLQLLTKCARQVILLLSTSKTKRTSVRGVITVLSYKASPRKRQLRPTYLFRIDQVRLPCKRSPSDLLRKSNFISFHHRVAASLRLTLLRACRRHLLQRVTGAIDSLSLYLSYRSQVSLLSLLTGRGSHLSHIAVQLKEGIIIWAANRH